MVVDVLNKSIIRIRCVKVQVLQILAVIIEVVRREIDSIPSIFYHQQLHRIQFIEKIFMEPLDQLHRIEHQQLNNRIQHDQAFIVIKQYPTNKRHQKHTIYQR